jgi:molecular chaperone DnaK
MSIIGIDLGTTFSGVSVVEGGKSEIIPVGDERIMPSVVALTPEGKWLVGRPALNQRVLHPENTVRSIKRKMGSDETVTLGGKAYTPPQISAMILQALKQTAESHMGEKVERAVITVPAYFSDAQRRATRNAGEIAGLEVARMINEPTAASLAYGLTEGGDQVTLVYDLGGGTFDVSLVEMMGGVVDVRASHGDTHLGGDDFDERLADWLVKEFESKHGVDLRGERQALARIQRAAERAKIALSSEPFTWVREEYLVQKRGQPLHMEIEVSRTLFTSLIDDLLLSTLTSIDRVMEDGQVDKVDHVMLVGGSTHIPAIWDLVAEHTGVTPRQDVNPSEAVALGAGIQGAIVAGEPVEAVLVDITPFSLGIETVDFSPMGDLIEDRFNILIHRNATIPTSHEEVFQALHPQQTAADIKVYQGESPIASENELLGDFRIEGLKQSAPGMEPQIVVLFDIDVNGMLSVRGVDRGSGKEEVITVKASRERMSRSQIQSARHAMPVLESGRAIPDELVEEMEVLLARSAALLAEQEDEELKEAVQEVNAAWADRDEDALTDALDDLTDILYDLEQDE